MPQKHLLTGITLILLLGFALSTPALAQPVPDTGQTKCYDNTSEIPCPAPGQDFYGQDGNYIINPMSYTKLDASGNDLPDSATSWVMVRDNVTGLIWEVKTADNKYDTYTWNEAHTYAANLRLGGFSDWRLPTIVELQYLVDFNIPSPGPTIDTSFFPNTLSYPYWSSSTSAYGTDYAWVVSFGAGYDYGSSSKTDSLYVRAVRGGQSIIGSFDRFKDNGDDTISDTVTGLMWQKKHATSTMNWEQALAYSETLRLGGYSDWRLPTSKELKSIVDYSRHDPAINRTYFPNTVASWYWSSSTDAGNTIYAWVVYFYNGSGPSNDKTSSRYVRAVRGGQPDIGSFGSLTISIEPAEARTAGAQWRRTGTNTWHNSGAIEDNIPAGSQIVEFKTVNGWNTPTSLDIIITAGQTARETGIYTITQHTVSATAGTGGTVTPTSRTVGHGGTASFTVTPDSGYIHGDVGGTCPVGTFSGNTYTTGSITGNCSVSFSFIQIQHTVTATASSGGRVSPASRTVGHGGTASFTVTPDTGYSYGNVGGTCPAGSFSGNTWTTGTITAGCTVSFSFAQSRYTVTATAGSGGSVTPASRIVGQGGTASFSVTPETGKTHGSVGGTCPIGVFSGNTYTTGAVTQNCQVQFSFVSVSAEHIQAERIFNAAEELYPAWFHPAGQPVDRYDRYKHPMFYRYYPARNIYLLTYDGHVYYFYAGRYHAWHSVADWLRYLDGDVGRYMDNGNGTVTDTITGLMWVQAPHELPGNTTAMNWQQAMNFCNNLSFAGYRDWRLPLIESTDATPRATELDTLGFIDGIPLFKGGQWEGLADTPFRGFQPAAYWSGSSVLNYETEAWTVGMSLGNLAPRVKTEHHFVWPVRGGAQ